LLIDRLWMAYGQENRAIRRNESVSAAPNHNRFTERRVITQRQAAEEIGQTERHIRRPLKQVKAEGDRPSCMRCAIGDRIASWTKRSRELRWEILSREVYAGFGPTLAAE
jgi:hypothetical protein